jgi:hypothetical protein
MALTQNWPYHRTILAPTTLSSDDQTYVKKLPLSNYMHTLLVKCKMTNGSTSARNQDMSDVVDKIEVVANGSDILYSLTPREIKQWNLWSMGKNIVEVRNERADAVQEAVYPIYFGRGMLDPDYFLPCARLSDLELRVTYSPTIAATSFATGTFNIAVYGLFSMGAPPAEYRGTLGHKTLYAFTTAASGDEQVPISRGNLLRSVLVSCYEAGIEDGVDLTNVKFDLNNGERVLFDIAWKDLQDWNTQDNWIFHEEHILAFLSNDDVINSDVARIVDAQAHPQTAVLAASDIEYQARIDAIAGDQLTFDAYTMTIAAGSEVAAADTTDRNVLVYVRGIGFSHAVVLDFAKHGEAGLLNTQLADQIRLTLTQGAAGGAARVSTQEVRVF